MSASASIGSLADAKVNDDEGFEWKLEGFAAVAQRLQKAGLPSHVEPEDLPEEASKWVELPGYGHHLRRLAAWVALRDEFPESTSREPIKDPVYIREYFEALEKNPEFPFRHLIDHADGEGYYIPIDFPRPLEHDEETKMAGGPIGSVHRLLAELKMLADRLEVPMEDDGEALRKLLWTPGKLTIWQRLKGQKFADNPWAGDPKAAWHDFVGETQLCLDLMHLCRLSLQTGSAISFG